MASSSMYVLLSQQDVLTSSGWNLCWGQQPQVLSFHSMHPTLLHVISSGGQKPSPLHIYVIKSHSLRTPLITAPIPMQV